MAEAGTRTKLSIKRLVLFVFLPLILLVGAGVGVMTSGMIKSNKPKVIEPEVFDPKKLPASYSEVPDLLINLRAKDGSPRLVIMGVTLAFGDPNARAEVNNDIAKVTDVLILYLRKTTPEIYSKAAELEAVRQEMERRVQEAIKPVELKSLQIRSLQMH
ncbi:MAG: flagellar basal body-associated FliL family protein [Proteobacteria bacterium]|nr:flagellar basal body-associated FliL family protein [Pseudomonadota bacterium]MBI3499322.1 flagellar basal body-associated FliL family protein [Pseudomonadota bacterium]